MNKRKNKNRKSTRILKINLWKYIDIEALNNTLDEVLIKEGKLEIAEDISYKFLRLNPSKDGECRIHAHFNLGS